MPDIIGKQIRPVPWLVILFCIASFFWLDEFARKRMNYQYQSYLSELDRQKKVESDFIEHIVRARDQPDWPGNREGILARELWQFAPLHWETLKDEDNAHRLTFEDRTTGDYFDATFRKNSFAYLVDCNRKVSPRSTTAEAYFQACVILSWLVPTVLIIGFASFYLPRSFRPWIVGSALLTLLGSVMGTDRNIRYNWSPWMIAPAVTFGLSIMSLGRVRARKGRNCKRCGYNLTGNLSGICPECGTPAPLPPKKPEILVSDFDLIE